MSAHTTSRNVAGVRRRVWRPRTWFPAGPPRAFHRTGQAFSFGDQYWGGLGEVPGTVEIEQPDGSRVPAARRVLLLERRTAIVIDETFSNAETGAYRFRGVDPNRRYMVIAQDYKGEYNAVIDDYVEPDLAP